MVERAFIDNYLPANPMLKVERISNIEVMRNYLPAEEIDLLKASPVQDDIVYQTSMFAILTGLRFSAIQSLKWNYLEYSKQLDAFYLYFIDPKPQRPIKHFVSKQAVELIGERKAENEFIFPDLIYSRTRDQLKSWLQAAGIRKKITFHCTAIHMPLNWWPRERIFMSSADAKP